MAGAEADAKEHDQADETKDPDEGGDRLEGQDPEEQVPVAVSAVASLLAETLNLPQWLRNVSPFEHVPSYPAASFELLPLAVLTLVAVIVAIVGLAGIARRDIG